MDSRKVLASQREQEMGILYRKERVVQAVGCEEEAPREGPQLGESLHRQGIFHGTSEVQEV